MRVHHVAWVHHVARVHHVRKPITLALAAAEAPVDFLMENVLLSVATIDAIIDESDDITASRLLAPCTRTRRIRRPPHASHSRHLTQGGMLAPSPSSFPARRYPCTVRVVQVSTALTLRPRTHT